MSTQPDSRQIINRTALPMVGSAANEALNSILGKQDAELAKLFEDRNIQLSDGGIIAYSSGSLTFTQSLKLAINSKISGASPMIVDLGSATISLSNGSMFYVVIDRTAGTATSFTALTLPAVTSANQEVFLIAKRSDTPDAVQRVYFAGGFALTGGDSTRLYAAGTDFASSVNSILVDSAGEILTANGNVLIDG